MLSEYSNRGVWHCTVKFTLLMGRVSWLLVTYLMAVLP